ncbi:hypothetical protein [Coraliomargarita akajimensis]|uniref:Uncharacterized protein n=1 Tax=Coraliomargarita akajimensis (strain DSM 45221 / IAM 15411 / JCM 23193 / KCTC 12865 / 04OKA010-24) TaxID=583355 RepID=D5EQK2_CORAD|nr:hypothetical protein [Coraliomargarita akajimensis]ADE55816.1 hypothetical protein Caka_2803 [Coraliomargarita akajimensis DSM 45221]
MLPYLQILVRVESDGSLHALGAFTSKEKQKAYQQAAGLKDSEVRLDFYNGPFDSDIAVIYAGHRQWNMDSFQLGGYFRTEGDAWNSVTQEGYVSVLRIDTTHEAEQELQREALERYAKLQRRWRLSSIDELIKREGKQKAQANIKLRFYEDALESFRPKTERDMRALYVLALCLLILPSSVMFFMKNQPNYGENHSSVNWLPETATNVSFYRSKQIQVYEFNMDFESFKAWAKERGLEVRQIGSHQIISRYKAYLPNKQRSDSERPVSTGVKAAERLDQWQQQISAKIYSGFIALGPEDVTVLYDATEGRVYFEQFIGF